LATTDKSAPANKPRARLSAGTKISPMTTKMDIEKYLRSRGAESPIIVTDDPEKNRIITITGPKPGVEHCITAIIGTNFHVAVSRNKETRRNKNAQHPIQRDQSAARRQFHAPFHRGDSLIASVKRKEMYSDAGRYIGVNYYISRSFDGACNDKLTDREILSCGKSCPGGFGR